MPPELPECRDQDWQSVHKAILRYARGRLGDVDLAEDVAQETLARLIAYCDAHEVATVYGLGFRIARNLIVDHHRAPARNAVELSDAIVCDNPTPERIVAAKQAIAQIVRALGTMPRLRREVLTRRRLHDESCASIARALNLSPKAVEKHITRGLDDLCKTIGALDRDD